MQAATGAGGRAVIGPLDDVPNGHIYSWSVRQPFPILPILLTDDDAAIPIDLNDVFATTYTNCRYDQILRKTSTGLPAAPLAPAEREWAAEVGAKR